MAYTRTYHTIIPIARDGQVDDSVTVWLTRESFERKAAGDALVLTDFTDLGEVDPADISPKAEKQLGRPATDFVWRSFTGTGARA